MGDEIPTLISEADLAPYMDGEFGISVFAEAAAERAVNAGESVDWDRLYEDIEQTLNVDLGSSLESAAIKAIDRITRKFVRDFKAAG